MNRLWSLLFLTVPVLGTWLFVYAWLYPEQTGWWLPEMVSTYGGEIDHLYNVILVITGITFLGVNIALVWFMFRFVEQKKGRAVYTHGNHKLELIWTAIPAVILFFLAIYQVGTWRKIKFQSEFPKTEPLVHVTAGQFEWRFTYPGPDGEYGTMDDFETVTELHVPADTDVLIRLSSRDVLHSFFLPEFRIKQDAVPGLDIPVWFNATKTGEFDLACAELCGWGHFRMMGRLYVHTPEEYEAWVKKTYEQQRMVQ